jgi:PEP-CTERM motif
MKLSTQWLTGAISAFVAAILLSFSTPALADNYQVFSLGSANGTSLYGMDSSGAVVTYNSMCAFTSISCFETYVDGAGVSGSNFKPTLSWDNGAACGSGLSGLITSHTACNGDWTVFGNLYGNNGLLGGLYLDSGSGMDFLYAGSVDKIFVNSDGDIAWVDGLNEQIYEAVNTSPSSLGASSPKNFVPAAETPEPGSILLVGTGLVGLTAAIRSKMNRVR